MATDKLLSDDELKRIEERVNLATPGPWHVRFLDDSNAASLVAISTEADTGLGERLQAKGSKLPEVSRTLIAATLVQYPVRYVSILDGRWDENADFIANARLDVVKLLNEVKRLRAHQSTST